MNDGHVNFAQFARSDFPFSGELIQTRTISVSRSSRDFTFSGELIQTRTISVSRAGQRTVCRPAHCSPAPCPTRKICRFIITCVCVKNFYAVVRGRVKMLIQAGQGTSSPPTAFHILTYKYHHYWILCCYCCVNSRRGSCCCSGVDDGVLHKKQESHFFEQDQSLQQSIMRMNNTPTAIDNTPTDNEVDNTPTDNEVVVTTIWDAEEATATIENAKKFWHFTFKDNVYPRVFIDSFIMKILKDGGICSKDTFSKVLWVEVPEGFDTPEDFGIPSKIKCGYLDTGKLAYRKVFKIYNARDYRARPVSQDIYELYVLDGNKQVKVLSTDTKWSNWYNLMKIEASWACACGKRVSTDVWISAIKNRIKSKYKIDPAPYDAIIRHELPSILTAGQSKCCCIVYILLNPIEAASAEP